MRYLMIIRKYNTFSSQGTENPPFRFFVGTPGLGLALGLGLGVGLTLAYVTAAISATANVAEAIKINIKTILSSRDHDQRSCCARGVQLGACRACSISKLTQPQVPWIIGSSSLHYLVFLCFFRIKTIDRETRECQFVNFTWVYYTLIYVRSVEIFTYL